MEIEAGNRFYSIFTSLQPYIFPIGRILGISYSMIHMIPTYNLLKTRYYLSYIRGGPDIPKKWISIPGTSGFSGFLTRDICAIFKSRSPGFRDIALRVYSGFLEVLNTDPDPRDFRDCSFGIFESRSRFPGFRDFSI